MAQFRASAQRGLGVVFAAALVLTTGTVCTGATSTTGGPPTTPASQPVGGGAPSPVSLAPGSASPGVAASPGASAAFSVNATDDLKFDPPSLTVPRGATVTWQNTGQAAHTVTADPSKAANASNASLPPGVQPWDSGVLAGGQRFSRTFDTAGTYRYFCQPHETLGMTGTIVVSQ